MNSTAFQDRRFWMGGGVLVALVLVAASWFLLISPELSSASDTRSQAATTNTQNATVATANAKLAEQNRNIALLKGKLRGALYSLPTDSGLPAFTDEVSSIARFTAVRLTGVTVGSITAVSVTAPTTNPTSAASASPTPTPTSTATPASAAAASGQYAIPVTVTTAGSYKHQAAFIKSLQGGPRRVLVNSTQVSVAAGSRTGSVDSATTMTAQLTLYSAPMSKQLVDQLNTILAAH